MADDALAIWAQCCQRAGELAERGVHRLRIEHGSDARECDTRVTDLPRLLAEAPVGAVVRWEGGQIVRTAQGWSEL